VTQEQQDEEPKNVQPRQKKPARGQHPEDESPHYEPQQEHPSMKHRGDEVAAQREEAQTHHEAESKSHMCDEAQEQPSDPCMTDKWKETIKDQKCQYDAKQQRVDRRKHQRYHHPDEEATPDE
jgi:hypothetical protein